MLSRGWLKTGSESHSPVHLLKRSVVLAKDCYSEPILPGRFGRTGQEVCTTLAKESGEKSQPSFVDEGVVAPSGQLVLQP